MVAGRRALAAGTVGAVTALGLAAAVPSPALAGSNNVTATKGSDPTVLTGNQYECTLTSPQMTVNDGSEHGNVKLYTAPGANRFDVNVGGTRGYWNDAYLVEGNNPDGYSSEQCDGWGYGTADTVPVNSGRAGSLTATITMHTVNGFKGDAGFDIWLTGPSTAGKTGLTTADEEASTSTTEIMVWLNSPGIDRGQYDSLGYRYVDGRWWDVLYYTGHRADHPWNYIVFAAPLATSSAHTFTDHNIHLSTLIRYAADKGWVKTGSILQSIDAGFEWYEDTTGGTQIESYSLTGVN